MQCYHNQDLLIMSNHVIDIAHLYKSYQEIRAVHDLSFSVESATCFTILGPNGAGKTTASKTLYAKARADKNPHTTMSVFGFDPRKQELSIKALLGVVPQENNLDMELNVEQNLFIYALFYGLSRKKASTRIDELLDFMELGDRRSAPVRHLSGGMKRRLIIARALINNPQLLILDEPTTGLDLQVRDLIWDRLIKLKKGGVTLLLTTHYMEEARQLADTIMIMHKGKKVLEGKPDWLLQNKIEAHALTVPDVSRIDLNTIDNVVRQERIGDRGLFYSDSLETLKKVAKSVQMKNYTIRTTNLEDIFIKFTGGILGEQQ